TEGVAAAAPLLMNAVYDAGSGAQSVYLGAQPGLLAVKRGWRLQGRFPTQGRDCLVGATAAQKLHLRLGQEFALPGLDGQKGRVTGLLAPTQGADDTFLYLPLAEAQRLFRRPHELTHILVRLRDPDDLDR